MAIGRNSFYEMFNNHLHDFGRRQWRTDIISPGEPVDKQARPQDGKNNFCNFHFAFLVARHADTDQTALLGVLFRDQEEFCLLHGRGLGLACFHALEPRRTDLVAAELWGAGYWFCCPGTGKRAAKLFLPRGGHRFLSREAYRLGYA
jgi:hypothetical protein